MDKLNVLSDTFLLSSAIVNNVSELISLQSISVLTQSSLLLPLQNFNPVSAFFSAFTYSFISATLTVSLFFKCDKTWIFTLPLHSSSLRCWSSSSKLLFLTPLTMFSLLAVTAQVWRHFCCCTLLVERNNMCVLVWWRVSVAAGLVHQWLKAASSGSLGHDTAAASTDCTSSTDWAGTDWLWCGGTGPLPPSPPSLSLVTAGALHRPTRLVWLCVILHTNNVVLWATLFNRNFDHTTIMIEESGGLVIMYAMNQDLVNITIRQLWWIINLGIIYSEITLWHLSLN